MYSLGGPPMTDPKLCNAESRSDLAAGVLASFDASLAGLRAMGGEFLEERLRLVGRCESRLAAVKAETVAALARRDGEARAADVLRNDVRQSRGSAKRQVKEAGRLAQVPKTAQALGEGVITPQHARLIAEAAEQAPPGAPIDEQELLAAAVEQPADLFGATVRDHLNARDRGDLEARRRRQRSQRRLTWKRQPDGMFELFGRFDPLTGSRIETAITAAANRLWRTEDPDNRATPHQRLADALESLVTHGGEATGGAQGVDLLVIADYDILAGRLANPRLVDGTPLSAQELLRLACDANILPAIFDQKSRPLWLGRGRRHATKHQRSVLAARDKGCVGCATSPNWTQAHHVWHWEHGGRTDIDNMCLLCSHCHTLVHTNAADITQGPDGGFTLRHRRYRRVPSPAGNGTHHAPMPSPPTGSGAEVALPLRC
ncbi:MAG: DUF222 domain-containing protein [Acidimicrobiia bacterium]|nr:DUF222 domain-containing protein [Acidimicrobiia bacterium]